MREENEKKQLLTYLIVRQWLWSTKIFGPGLRTTENKDHVLKELKEIEENPFDLEERVDLLLLALDGVVRLGRELGLTPTQIRYAIWDKIEKNERRKWPALSDQVPGQAVLHIKEDGDASAESTG